MSNGDDAWTMRHPLLIFTPAPEQFARYVDGLIFDEFAF